MTRENELFVHNINEDIRKEVIENFGFYCQLLKSSVDGHVKLYMGFLPHGTLLNLSDKFTDSEKEIIKKNYKLFTDYYLEKLDVHPLFKQRYSQITQKQCDEFVNSIKTVMSLYATKNKGVQLQEIFEASLGLRDKGILPRFLQMEIYGSAK